MGKRKLGIEFERAVKVDNGSFKLALSHPGCAAPLVSLGHVRFELNSSIEISDRAIEILLLYLSKPELVVSFRQARFELQRPVEVIEGPINVSCIQSNICPV